MTDTTSDGAAPAAATDAAVATTTTDVQATIGATPAQQGYQWPADLPDDLRSVLDRTKWTDPVQVLEGYRNAEKLVSGQKVPLPKGPDDRDGIRRVLDAMGRPKDASEYKLELGNIPEGMPVADGMLDAFRAKAYELDLLPWQAQALTQWMVGEVNAKAWTDHQQSLQEAKLQTEAANRTHFGNDYERKMALAERMAQQRGYQDWTHLAPLFAEIGEFRAESRPGGMGTGAGTSMKTAKQEIEELLANRQFRDEFFGHKGDAARQLAKVKWDDLNSRAATEA